MDQFHRRVDARALIVVQSVHRDTGIVNLKIDISLESIKPAAFDKTASQPLETRDYLGEQPDYCCAEYLVPGHHGWRKSAPRRESLATGDGKKRVLPGHLPQF
jgi:hypothetical protein